MKKTKTATKKSHSFNQKSIVLCVAAVFLVVAIATPLVHADKFQEQIDALNQENNQKKTVQGQLGNEAAGLSNTISKLQAQINDVQTKLNDNQKKSEDLKAQIAAAEAELAKQKRFLGETIKSMYVSGEISTVEMLASSKDLSHYFDKQQYRESVSNKLKITLDKINQLKLDLGTQKEALEKVIKEQEVLRGQLAGQRAENDRLLGLNQEQQGALDVQIKANSSQVAKLQAQQAAAFARATGGGKRNFGSAGNFQFRNVSSQQPCGGGYNYCWAGLDQYVSDTWGLSLARECVHYAADRVARGVNLAPYLGKYWGAGNATNWPTNLSGVYPVDRTPAVGAVAIAKGEDMGTDAGHAMYVEYVLDDGWVGVSQMNWGGPGTYSTMEIKASGVWFIHF